MAYSDDTLAFNKSLLDALKSAQLEMTQGGGVKKVRKGDFQAEYRSLAELEQQIKKLEMEIFIEENGCVERKICQ